ncbi:MAG TPA: hypothetical protein VLL54_18700 [Pyrinomonadaceae bacterium]|nr:hypothetical protein [Pyrinomonadaceae bacterium]
MSLSRFALVAFAMIVLSTASATFGQGRPDSAALMAAERDAMKPLAMMDGVWRGPAETVLPSGEKHRVTQTERIGPFLGGTIKLLEGRGYNEDGTVGFNAFGIVSYDPANKTYSLHSHALGLAGDFSFKPTADGYVWEIPAGPMIIRYTAVIKDGAWREVGDRIIPGKDPVRFFEMNLKRVGDSDWPGAGAISPK